MRIVLRVTESWEREVTVAIDPTEIRAWHGIAANDPITREQMGEFATDPEGVEHWLLTGAIPPLDTDADDADKLIGVAFVCIVDNEVEA